VGYTTDVGEHWGLANRTATTNYRETAYRSGVQWMAAQPGNRIPSQSSKHDDIIEHDDAPGIPFEDEPYIG
jgi:hypothetical protein